MLTSFVVALAATLQNCEDAKNAYKTQCCGNEPLAAAPFDASCEATGFGSNLHESCGEPSPLGDLLHLDNSSLALKSMRAAYRVLLRREPKRDEVEAAFTINDDDSLTSKLSYNQMENKLLRDNDITSHLLETNVDLSDEVYVVVGGSGGLGFSAAVSMAMYTNIKKVYIIGGRDAAPFEAQKKVAMTGGECQKDQVAYSEWDAAEAYPSDVRNAASSASVQGVLRRDTCEKGALGVPNVMCNASTTVTVQLRRQECDPMYYGPLDVPQDVFDEKIEFIATDVRIADQVKAAVAQIDKLPIGIFYAQIGSALFVDIATSEERANTIDQFSKSRDYGYQPNTAYPNATEFNANVALGVDHLIQLTPDRQTSSIETSGSYDSMGLSTYKLGTGNVQNAFFEKFGIMNVMNTTVITEGGSTTSFGAKLNSQYPIPAFSEYLGMKAINLRRIQSWGASGGRASSSFADGMRTQAFMAFMEAPGSGILGLPTWFRLLYSDDHDFNTQIPFMLASQNLISTNESHRGVYSTFTNADYDDMFNAIQYIDTGFNKPDAAVFLTPHAHSLMYLHSFMRSLQADTQPVLLNALQYLAVELSDTVSELIDPAMRATFSSVTQFDCPEKREALASLHMLSDTSFGITPFADWAP